jgi:hypothetical protein
MPRFPNEPDDPWVLFAWAYYRDNYDELLAAVKRVIRSKAWKAAVSLDEAMGEVADRLPDVIRCYDPKKGPLGPHVTLNIKMYVYKHCRAATIGPRLVRMGKVKLTPIGDALLGSLSAPGERGPEARDAAERVQKLLTHPDMPPLFAWLLEARYVEEMSVGEIAQVLGEPQRAVKKYLEDALDAARYVSGAAEAGVRASTRA